MSEKKYLTHRLVVIIVRNGFWNWRKYDITIRRNITIIQGDSATGKTTLIGLIQDYYNEGRGSGVHLECEKACKVLAGRDWQKELENLYIMKHIQFMENMRQIVR